MIDQDKWCLYCTFLQESVAVKLHWMFRYFKKLLTSFTLRLNTLLTVFLSLSHFTAIENALVCFLKDACSLSLQSQLKGVHTGFLLGKKKWLFFFWGGCSCDPDCPDTSCLYLLNAAITGLYQSATLPGCVSRSSLLAELHSCSMGSVGRCHSKKQISAVLFF